MGSVWTSGVSELDPPHGSTRSGGPALIQLKQGLDGTTVRGTDKTGTLTSAEIALARSLDPSGREDARPARLGAVAADLGGDGGSLDTALVASHPDAVRGRVLGGQRAFDYGRRTSGRPWHDRPSAVLAGSSLAALAVALALPFSPAGAWFGFQTPSPSILLGIGLITVAYLAAVEIVKPWVVRPRHGASGCLTRP